MKYKFKKDFDCLKFHRHYVDVHGYDASIADAPDADDEMPDGALCTECGEIFINR